MEVIREPAALQALALDRRGRGVRIGLVPTMGFLHEGHASLMRLARRHADLTMVSLFVNPTQFGPREDLSRYPRDFGRDHALCTREGVDVLFAPEASALYPPGYSTYVAEEQLSRGLCGASRPGHFRGVCTVVAKLFHLALPHVAVFGEKDAQQLRVIRRMVRDLDFPVEILAGPTLREPDGLAMSSRNQYLSPDERREALVLRRALDRAEALHAGGEREAGRLRAAMMEILAGAPHAKVDYIELVDDVTLEPVEHLEGPVLVALAVFVGTTRLIDNTRLA